VTLLLLLLLLQKRRQQVHLCTLLPQCCRQRTLLHQPIHLLTHFAAPWQCCCCCQELLRLL
jgi:hypothetical protein